MNKINKRFIAGAVCPQCQLIDKLVVYRENDLEFCECVRCGHKRQQETEPKPVLAKVGKKEQIIRVIRNKSR
jgi:uncharacterized metal-binding protein (TIGR02443 family)